MGTFRKPICTAGIDVSLQSHSKITATVCWLYAVSVGAVGYIPSIAILLPPEEMAAEHFLPASLSGLSGGLLNQ